MPEEHGYWSQLVAAAVIGSLSAAEHAQLRTHTTSCTQCRRDLAELTTVAHVVSAAHASKERSLSHPGPHLQDRVVDAVGRARRRQRRINRLAYAVAASAACLGFLGLGLALPEASGPPQEAVAVVAQSGIDADISLVVHTWGTEVKLVASGLRQGETYDVMLVADDGTRVAAGTFLGVDDRPIVCDMNAAVQRSEAAALEVLDASGKVVMAADL